MTFARAICILVLATTPVYADEISKEACLDAHGRGQDARDSGKLSLARKLFLTCAQSACPALVQGDCAKFANDLTAVQPTITFAARDAGGSDLPDTTVFVDDVLLLTRLDGKPHDIDPGNHTIKFQNGGRDQVVTVVINSGEKGRTVVGTFPAAAGAQPPVGGNPVAGAGPQKPEVSAPLGSKILIVAGGAMLVGGAALAVVGLTGIPDGCDLGTHQCAAPPNDPVFGEAKTAVRNFNIGMIVGGVGAAALIGGIVWFVGGGDEAKPADTRTVFAPYVTPDGGGFAISGRL